MFWENLGNSFILLFFIFRVKLLLIRFIWGSVLPRFCLKKLFFLLLEFIWGSVLPRFCLKKLKLFFLLLEFIWVWILLFLEFVRLNFSLLLIFLEVFELLFSNERLTEWLLFNFLSGLEISKLLVFLNLPKLLFFRTFGFKELANSFDTVLLIILPTPFFKDFYTFSIFFTGLLSDIEKIPPIKIIL